MCNTGFVDVLLNRIVLIVGQVTPTMLAHIGYGTFVFFGVSYVTSRHNVSIADLLQLWAFLGGAFIWMFVRCILQSLYSSSP